MYKSNATTTTNQPNTTLFIHPGGGGGGGDSSSAVTKKSATESSTTLGTMTTTLPIASSMKHGTCSGGGSGGSGGSGESTISGTAASSTVRVAPTVTTSETSTASQQQQKQQQQHEQTSVMSLAEEVWASTEIIFSGRATWLLALGPVAIFGDMFGSMSEAMCFACSGIALIPCAERLSFVTEQVALHTNGTIGALLNATFGNAPELLISIAALRSGFYRVVQLAMLGSMITNMLFVFGVSCLIGGLRWQVQTIRPVSGSVSVGMLLIATAGSLIPATLILSGQFQQRAHHGGTIVVVAASAVGRSTELPTHEEVTLSRVNAAVMLILYLCYIIFQLGTHKDEFDEASTTDSQAAPPNVFCRALCARVTPDTSTTHSDGPLSPMHRGIKKRTSNRFTRDDPFPSLSIGEDRTGDCMADDSFSAVDEEEAFLHSIDESYDVSEDYMDRMMSSTSERRRRRGGKADAPSNSGNSHRTDSHSKKLNGGLTLVPNQTTPPVLVNPTVKTSDDSSQHPVISMRVGIVWLFIITFCVSAMSDILVGTIDGFAQRMKLSQVFTSMVIVPFFSNVAEQVTAFIFAYRNKMDLVVGVTIGSAIQIATFVLPGSVLIGMVMDRSMTLYFHSYETVCLLLCTLIVAAVLQGGTTNWMVGAMLIGTYTMFAAGIWFHEVENLSTNLDRLEG